MNDKEFANLLERNRVAQLIWSESKKQNVGYSDVEIESIERWVANEQLPDDRTDIIRAVRELEQLDAIKLIVGRRGAKSRIKWQVKPEEITLVDESAQGIDAPTATATEEIDPPHAHAHSSEVPQAPSETEFVTHPFLLRPKLKVSLSLPVDLTGTEVERLYAFLKTLPFEATS